MEELKKTLGSKAVDNVTGFAGTVTGVAAYLTGEDQVCIEPKVGEGGEYKEGRWFDKRRVSFTFSISNGIKYIEDQSRQIKELFGQKDKLSEMHSESHKHLRQTNCAENNPKYQNPGTTFPPENIQESAYFIQKEDASVQEIDFKIRLK